MILYHGSNMEINNIDLAKCRPYKDFGRGFYLTIIKEQAFKMADRVARIYGGNACVTAFEFIEDNAEYLKVKSFDTPSKEWAMFVINNRNRDFNDISSPDCNNDNKFDIVIGPVADDDLALLFRQFSNGYIGLDTLIREMKFKQLTNQYSFHTENAIKCLKKVGAVYE